MSEQHDPDRLADELEGQADRLQARSDELHGQIEDVRDDWERKRADESVPGAPPRQDGSDRDTPQAEVSPKDARREEHESPETPARSDPERET
jgi:hypothetical protein